VSQVSEADFGDEADFDDEADVVPLSARA